MAIIDRNQWPELEQLLDHALELTGASREEWLVQLRTDAPALAETITALLSADARADQRGFLEPRPATLTGSQVGHYTLINSLGHGGMGSVWLARRTDGRFDGYAAVKLMNLSLMSATGQARFRREGTALARLTHHAIARLLDAGVASTGQPYLVLEYVDGQRIDVHADAASLSQHQRIDLLLQVMDAVGHAHANLVVHRDLKPSNILVTADGQVKLLDFGIAKLLQEQGEEEQTALTAAAGSALTPDYASPEQIRGENITTATDVYALGVLLYIILSGKHPTRGAATTPIESARSILEVEPRRLGLGDLDTIIAKALRKLPLERYDTVAAFADDLRRYQRHEPVRARPDSLSYRASKFFRRNRMAVAAATLVSTVLVVATVFSAVQARRATTERDAAIRSAQRAFAMSELQSVLASDSRDPDGLPLTPAGRIRLAEEMLVQRFRGEPWLISEVMIDLSGRLFESLDRGAERAMLARAAAIAQEGGQSALVAVAACLRATSFWGDDLMDSSRSELAVAKAALVATSDAVDNVIRATCLEAEGKALQARDQPDSAIAFLRQAVGLTTSNDARRLSLAVALSEVLRLTGRNRESAEASEQVLAELVQSGYGNTDMLPNVVTFVDRSLADLGEFRASDSIVGAQIRQRERLAGPGRVPSLLAFLYGQGKLRLGETDSADKWIALATSKPWQEGGVMTNWLPSVLAQIRMSQGRLADARTAAARLPSGLRGRRATAAMVNAMLLQAGGKPKDATRLLEHELSALYAESKATQSLFTLPLVTAGEWRLAAGDAAGADSLARLGLRAAIIDSLAPTRSGLAGRAELLLAQSLHARGEVQNAKAATARAIVALSNGYGVDNTWTRSARALRDTLLQ